MSTRLNISKQSLLKWSVASLLLAIPLYPKFPLFTIPGSQVALRLEDFLLLIICIAVGILYKDKIKALLSDKLTQSFLLFWFIGFISLASGIWITRTISPTIGLFHWVRRIEYMLPFFIGYLAINKKQDIRFYIRCLLIIVVFAFVYGVGQKYFDWPIITTQNTEYAKGIALQYVPGAHLVSTFAGHYDLSSFLVLVLPLFIALLFSKTQLLISFFRTKNSVLPRVFLGCITAAGLWLLVNAANRISLVSYLGSASLVLLLTRRLKFIPLVLIASILFVGFSSNLIDRYMRIIEVTLRQTAKISIEQFVPAPLYAADLSQVSQRRTETPVPQETAKPVFEDRSTSIRLNVEWPRAIRSLTKNPLLGTGYSSLTLATDNDYLRMLGEVGLLGFLAFFLIMIRISYELLFVLNKKITLSSTFVLASVAALPGIALNMVFIDILEASKFAIMFWLLSGMSVGLARKLHHE